MVLAAHYQPPLLPFFHVEKILKKSCELGIKYVNSAIITNPKFGKGNGPINHLNSIELNRNYK
jgi:hydroxymethylpyrimidine/phosphomethylpyrimidine kinase